ncbi:hypothetical protein DSECCO2_427680 [anaerobic digester metagenome]
MTSVTRHSSPRSPKEEISKLFSLRQRNILREKHSEADQQGIPHQADNTQPVHVISRFSLGERVGAMSIKI